MPLTLAGPYSSAWHRSHTSSLSWRWIPPARRLLLQLLSTCLDFRKTLKTFAYIGWDHFFRRKLLKIILPASFDTTFDATSVEWFSILAKKHKLINDQAYKCGYLAPGRTLVRWGIPPCHRQDTGYPHRTLVPCS